MYLPTITKISSGFKGTLKKQVSDQGQPGICSEKHNDAILKDFHRVRSPVVLRLPCYAQHFFIYFFLKARQGTLLSPGESRMINLQ